MDEHTEYDALPEKIPEGPPPIPAVAIHEEQPEFTGNAGEYFRIWLVNIALTILTLGIYTPWARVRTRRYFYQHTRVFGEPFDYLADPRKILLGFLILVVFYAAFLLLEFISPILPLLVAVLFVAVLPWLIFKTHRFFAANSAYRNVTLRFTGTLREAYVVYLLGYVLTILTAGLLYPYVVNRRKAYFTSHLNYGSLKGRFYGSPGKAYKIYLKTIGILLIVALALGALFYVVTAFGMSREGVGGAIIGVMITFYSLIFICYGMLNVFLHNYLWNHFSLDDRVSFVSTMAVGRYIWIALTNFLACVLSLFLLLPWAKVRMHRYKLSCLQVAVAGELDDVISAGREDVGAFGDSAAEMFDLDFGF